MISGVLDKIINRFWLYKNGMSSRFKNSHPGGDKLSIHQDNVKNSINQQFFIGIAYV